MGNPDWAGEVENVPRTGSFTKHPGIVGRAGAVKCGDSVQADRPVGTGNIGAFVNVNLTKRTYMYIYIYIYIYMTT